jgi:hypothetical protein
MQNGAAAMESSLAVPQKTYSKITMTHGNSVTLGNFIE